MLDIFDQQSNEIDKTVVIGTNTAIVDQSCETGSDFTLYPNPCNGLVSLSFNVNEHRQVILTMYDLTGRVIWNNVLLTPDNNALDISTQRNGIYFIKVCDKNSDAVQYIKLVKEGF